MRVDNSQNVAKRKYMYDPDRKVYIKLYKYLAIMSITGPINHNVFKFFAFHCFQNKFSKQKSFQNKAYKNSLQNKRNFDTKRFNF